MSWMPPSLPRTIILSTSLFVLFLSPSFAQEETSNDASDAPAVTKIEDPAAVLNEIDQDINQEISEQNKSKHQQLTDRHRQIFMNVMTKGKPQEQRHFMMMYSIFNVKEVTERVIQDVNRAIKACGEKNPDMKEKLDTRYEAWRETFRPLIEKANGQVNNMMLTQEYATSEELEEVFGTLTASRLASETQLTQIPVTTPQACEYLLAKMNETEMTLTYIIDSTMKNVPQIVTGKEQEPLFTAPGTTLMHDAISMEPELPTSTTPEKNQ